MCTIIANFLMESNVYQNYVYRLHHLFATLILWKVFFCVSKLVLIFLWNSSGLWRKKSRTKFHFNFSLFFRILQWIFIFVNIGVTRDYDSRAPRVWVTYKWVQTSRHKFGYQIRSSQTKREPTTTKPRLITRWSG